MTQKEVKKGDVVYFHGEKAIVKAKLLNSVIIEINGKNKRVSYSLIKSEK